ncbi:MAG: MetQ/NlpA family ABC transporter substrate-binding protein [Saezia sp.]
MQKRVFLLGVAATAFSLLFSGAALAQGQVFRVGVTPGPHAQIMEKVKEVAARDGLKIEILEFSNYVVPNQALASKELDANSFQHKPYLENQVKAQNLNLVSAADTVLLPMAVYSKKITSIADLRDKAVVGIPNDPSNGGRALLVLQQMGLIKLDPNAGLLVTPTNIIENPKKLEFFELEAAQLPHSLAEFDIAVVNTNYAMVAGLNPKKDSIFIEGVDSPYVNIIAVRAEDKDSERVAAFVRAYHSEEVKAFVNEISDGAILPSW